jgi:hypothetical protein
MHSWSESEWFCSSVDIATGVFRVIVLGVVLLIVGFFVVLTHSGMIVLSNLREYFEEVRRWYRKRQRRENQM